MVVSGSYRDEPSLMWFEVVIFDTWRNCRTDVDEALCLRASGMNPWQVHFGKYVHAAGNEGVCHGSNSHSAGVASGSDFGSLCIECFVKMSGFL